MSEDEMIKRLEEKGWEDKEINNAVDIIYGRNESYKNKKISNTNNIMVYLSSLVITIVGNIILALFIGPLIVIIKSAWIYFIIAVIGAIFGVLYNSLLKDIKRIESRNYLIAEIIIPSIAFITVLIIVNIAATISTRLRIPIVQNPGIIAFIYFIAFVSPLIITKFREYQKKKAYA